MFSKLYAQSMFTYTPNVRFFSVEHPKITTGILTLNSKLDEFAQLCKNTFRSTYPSLFTNDKIEKIFENFRNVQLPNELQSNQYRYLYANSNGRYIGYAKLNIHTSSEAELEKLYISNEYKNQGVGLRLMTDAIKMALQHKRNSLSLFVWENNAKAIGFYEKHGFELTKKTTKNFGGKVVNGNIMSISDIEAWLKTYDPKNSSNLRFTSPEL